MDTFLTYSEHVPASRVSDHQQLDHEVHQLGQIAGKKRMLAIAFLKAQNGNEISFVAGGKESVLCFTYAHQEPPYLASSGRGAEEVPVLTALACMEHHTEYPSTWVIPMAEATGALREFQNTGDLPQGISWVEI